MALGQRERDLIGQWEGAKLDWVVERDRADALEQRERDKVAAAYEDAVALTIAMAEGVRDGKLLPSCANPMLVFLGLTELGRAFHERARAALGLEGEKR